MNSKVFQNAKWIIVCQIAQMISGMLISMFSARYLGPSNYGILSYAGSVVAFITPFMHLGINNVLVHEFVAHKDKEGEVLGSATVLCVLSSVLCIIGVTAFAAVANPNDKTTVIVCALYSVKLLFQAMDTVRFWFQAKLMSKYASLISLGAFFVVSVYKIILLITQKSIYWFALSNALDYLVIIGFMLGFYKKLGGGKLTFSCSMAKSLFHSGKHYIIPSMMILLYSQVDKIMIKGMMNETEVGYYSAAITCITYSSFVFSAIIDSFRPVVFEKKKQDPEGYKSTLSRLYSVIIYLALLQSVALAVFGKYAILLLYGEQYLPAIGALRIAGWYAMFSHIGSARNVWVLAENRQKHLWSINLIGGITNVVLNAFMIPIIGINGAALATLLTQFTTNVVATAIMPQFRESMQFFWTGLNPKTILSVAKDALSDIGRKNEKNKL